MFIAGISYFSPHKVTEAIASKYRLHLFLHLRKKIHKGRKKKVEGPTPEELRNDESVQAVKDFLPGKDPEGKEKILLVAGMDSFFAVRKAFKLERNRKNVVGILVFDNPSNLFDYHIRVLDAEKVKEGMWWKRQDFIETALLKAVKDHIADKKLQVDVVKIKPIKRKKFSSDGENKTGEEVKGSGKVRGFISHFIQQLKVHLDDDDDPGVEKRMLRIVLGNFLGVVPKSEYEEAVKILTSKYEVQKKLLASLDKYAKSKHGDHLICTFYLTQKGKSFAMMQREFKSMVMDDWLVLQEYVPSTTKHKFYRKPDVD